MTSRTDKSIRDDALIFYQEDIDALNAILDAFLKKSAAKSALLVDKDGHMITSRGDTENTDLDTISALVAGSFAATRALAHQFGEKDFTALFHQGRSESMQLALVGDRALLTALFDDNTTIGMVRLYATEAARRLTQLFEQKRERERAAVPAGGDRDNGAFKEGASGALDEVFGDA